MISRNQFVRNEAPALYMRISRNEAVFFRINLILLSEISLAISPVTMIATVLLLPSSVKAATAIPTDADLGPLIAYLSYL